MSFLDIFRRKSSTALDTSEKIADAMGIGYSTDAGVTVTANNAMQISTVFSCVRVLSESVGMLPLNLKESNGEKRNNADEHPLHVMFKHGPNSFQTALEWKETVISHLALRGNHYSYINRAAGKVRELLPLNPASVKPKISNDWEVEYEVTFPNGTKDTLPASDILHIKLFSLDGVNGLSPISWARNSLGLAKATEKHGAKLFANGAHPSGGFSTDKVLNEDYSNRLEEKLNDYTGDGVHKNLVLEGGLKWFQATMSNEDAQFLDTRKYQRTDICGIFRIPPHMVADLEKATFSNIEHQGLMYVQHTLMPYLLRIEQRADKSLLTKNEQKRYFTKFNVNALLRGDMKARAEFYNKLLQSGALSPNEIRRFEDMNPREGGDIYLTPMNMTTNPTDEDEGETPEKAA